VLNTEPLVLHAEIARLAVLYEDLRIEILAASEASLPPLDVINARHRKTYFLHRFEAALRLLDEDCRVYQYLSKRRIEADLNRAIAQLHLKVVELEIPPLRERPDDVRGLAHAILAARAQQMARAISGYTAAALEVILRYHWPGNVRELENVIERACALATGPDIDVADLPPELTQSVVQTPVLPFVRPLSEVEREYILATLKQNRGDKKRTAEQLHIAMATLFRKLKQYSPTPE
jgi:transcriptional regulator of aromatic amino acid metabolism